MDKHIRSDPHPTLPLREEFNQAVRFNPSVTVTPCMQLKDEFILLCANENTKEIIMHKFIIL